MVRGGLIDRYVRESIFEHANTELTARGWFDVGREHAPIIVTYEFPQDDSPVETNTLAMSVGDSEADYVELGSTNFQKTHTYIFDFFAENDSLGSQLIGDLMDYFIIEPNLAIYDYQDAKAIIMYAEVIDAFTDRANRVTQPWQKHWNSLAIAVEEGIRG